MYMYLRVQFVSFKRVFVVSDAFMLKMAQFPIDTSAFKINNY